MDKFCLGLLKNKHEIRLYINYTQINQILKRGKKAQIFEILSLAKNYKQIQSRAFAKDFLQYGGLSFGNRLKISAFT